MNAIIRLINTVINLTPLNNAKIQVITERTKYSLAGVQSFLKSFRILYICQIFYLFSVVFNFVDNINNFFFVFDLDFIGFLKRNLE